MKPRIRLRHGVWYCGLWWAFEGRFIWPPYGHGHTPSEALREWLVLRSLERGL